jgi:hypothetical protein
MALALIAAAAFVGFIGLCAAMVAQEAEPRTGKIDTFHGCLAFVLLAATIVLAALAGWAAHG